MYAGDFHWLDTEESEVRPHGRTAVFLGSKLVHTDSQFFYRCGLHIDKCSPGQGYRVQAVPLTPDPQLKWQDREIAFGRWLLRLREEVQTSDLWAEIAKTKSLSIKIAITSAEEKFDEKEIGYLHGELNRIEAQIQAIHKLTTSQTEAIHGGFEEIRSEMNRFGKKDWANMATGLLFNIMVGSALAPSAARDLYNMFAAAVAPLLDVAHKLLH